MTGRVLTGYRHELQITTRWAGHFRAAVWGAIFAGLAVMVLGI